MQTNFMIREGAIEVNDEGKIHINIEKVVPAAQKMLSEAIRVQLSRDVNEAETMKLVAKYMQSEATDNKQRNFEPLPHTRR